MRLLFSDIFAFSKMENFIISEKLKMLSEVDLLQKKSLLIAGELHRLVEVERYHYSEEHRDDYVHCHPDQQEKNGIYFHCLNKNLEKRGYKGGTFKGMDLVVSRDGEEFYAYLVRSIQLPSGEVISGPCKVVNYILEKCQKKNILELTKGQLLRYVRDEKDEQVLELVDWDYPAEEMWVGKRIGLSGRYPEFKDKEYRFVILKKHVLKDKKGLSKYTCEE